MARERVLIIEDEEDIQELLAYNLEKEGYRVERTSSGEEAFLKVRQSISLPGI